MNTFNFIVFTFQPIEERSGDRDRLFRMNWYQEDEYEDEEEEDLMFSPALLARRASESWIVTPPAEVFTLVPCFLFCSFPFSTHFHHNRMKITYRTFKSVAKCFIHNPKLNVVN